MSLWTPTLISKVASCIGRPLYMDKATATRSRISYARVCIEVSADQELPAQIKFSVGNQECSLRLEYDRRPPRCSLCCVFGHGDMNCHLQPSREKAVWRPKQNQPHNEQTPQPAQGKEQSGGMQTNTLQLQTHTGLNLPHFQPNMPPTPTPTNSKKQPPNTKETNVLQPQTGTGLNLPESELNLPHPPHIPAANSSNKQPPNTTEQPPPDRKKQKGKQPMEQDNHSLVIHNRFQSLDNDTGNIQHQNQTDNAGAKTMAGYEQPDPPP